jgi:hypothetical protein
MFDDDDRPGHHLRAVVEKVLFVEGPNARQGPRPPAVKKYEGKKKKTK